MRVAAMEFTYLDVPFTAHTESQMRFWLPHWRNFQLCRVTLDNGVEGWGEGMPNYTWSATPDDIVDRVVGRPAAEMLWEDGLGANVQMALFDAVGKALDVPAYQLMGNKVREWCPISWWAMDMAPKDWARQCTDAVKQGYTSAKLKARTWYDLHAAIRAVIRVVPPQFKLDLDFNGTLGNVANAVEFLKTLEQYEHVAMIETPIPQDDIAGNAHIRQRINRPVAMHYGYPPIPTNLKEDVTDGYLIGSEAQRAIKAAHICELANKPFWLQYVGTGITTTWVCHLGAVLSHALWPAVTCMNLYRSQLVKEKIQVRGGYIRVPEKPGLGIEVDMRAVERYRVDYSRRELEKHLFCYRRASGEEVYYGVTRQTLGGVFQQDAMPVCEAGSRLEAVPDDGSSKFQELYANTRNGQTVRRLALRRR